MFVVVVDMSKKLERNESSDKLCNLPGVKEFDNSAFQEPSHKAPNVNVSWMAKRGAWSFQVIMILGMRYLLGVFGSSAFCWSLIFYLYAGATFYVFHWVKGTLISDRDTADVSEKTMWEQIDDGIPWTGTRKFLLAVPMVL